MNTIVDDIREAMSVLGDGPMVHHCRVSPDLWSDVREKMHLANAGNCLTREVLIGGLMVDVDTTLPSTTMIGYDMKGDVVKAVYCGMEIDIDLLRSILGGKVDL